MWQRTTACARRCQRTGRERESCFDAMHRNVSTDESDEYREEVLPNKCRKRVAIEAGVPEIWYQYVGLDGKVIGLHRFGLSAPGERK